MHLEKAHKNLDYIPGMNGLIPLLAHFEIFQQGIEDTFQPVPNLHYNAHEDMNDIDL
jgi:hypothetical protein